MKLNNAKSSVVAVRLPLLHISLSIITPPRTRFIPVVIASGNFPPTTYVLLTEMVKECGYAIHRKYLGAKFKILLTNLQMQWSGWRCAGQVQKLKWSSSHFTSASYVLNVSVQPFGFGLRHHSITYSIVVILWLQWTLVVRRPQLIGPRLRRKLSVLGNGKKEMNKHVLLCSPLPLWCEFHPAASPLFKQLKLTTSTRQHRILWFPDFSPFQSLFGS